MAFGSSYLASQLHRCEKVPIGLSAILRLSRTILTSPGTVFGSARALSVLSWPPSVAARRLLGVSWGCLGLSWAPFGPPFLGPLSQEAARQQECGPRECKEPPKGFPREPKRSPQKTDFSFLFRGQFLDPFRNSPSEGFLDAWSLQN